jgi:hypothetical protein
MSWYDIFFLGGGIYKGYLPIRFGGLFRSGYREDAMPVGVVSSTGALGRIEPTAQPAPAPCTLPTPI